MKETCYILTGPTACGKTSYSIRLAKTFNCEIICMDSMQIYRGMDIGTAKPTQDEMDGIPHHMLDVVDPDEAFSVASYQEMAENCAADIIARGKKPLFVGGTGFYLRALRHPMPMGTVAADDAYRDELQAIADTQENGKAILHDMLEQADPVTAQRLHPNDVRRVIRALEVFKATGIPFSMQPQEDGEARFRYKVAALTMDRQTLYDRINSRVDVMLEQGLVSEVKCLLDAGMLPHYPSMKGLGYKELIPYLQGEDTLEHAVYCIKQGSRHYAKRQWTWLRREEDLLWVDAMSSEAWETLYRWMQDDNR